MKVGLTVLNGVEKEEGITKERRGKQSPVPKPNHISNCSAPA